MRTLENQSVPFSCSSGTDTPFLPEGEAVRPVEKQSVPFSGFPSQVFAPEGDRMDAGETVCPFLSLWFPWALGLRRLCNLLSEGVEFRQVG